MSTYTVLAGDSPASVAGKVYGDQRRYVDLISANGGVWHPGDVIDIPDITGTPSPVITQAQFNAAPTGYQNGQPTYRGQTSGPATPTFSKPATPAFGGSGAHGAADQGQSSRWSTGSQQPSPHNTPTTAAGTPGEYHTPQTSNYPGPGVNNTGLRVPNSVSNKTQPVRAPGASRYANGSLSGFAGPMAGGFGPSQGQQIPNPPGFGNQQILPRQLAAEGMGAGGMTNPNAANDAYSARYGGQSAGYTPRINPQGGVDGSSGPPASAAQPTSTIDPAMANVAYAARYSTAAIYAYGGMYGPAWKGKRQTLPIVLDPRVANEIPIPSGFKDTPSFMASLGYAVDASGNYIRKDQMVSQGYGGGGNNYGTSSALPGGYGGYGGYGYGGYGGGGGSGTAAQAPGGPGMGLVSWRVTA